jgi:pimeloyl-ACP methyl ester carboxylesterase
MRDRPDYSGRLGEFAVPALVIGAEDDRAIPPEESRLLAAGLAGAKLCMIQQAGHMVMLEQPAAVNRALREFLAAA